MYLNCPQCQEQYRLDPALLGKDGRRVRCTSCGNIWLQTQPQEESDDLVIPAFPEMDVDFQEPRKEQREERAGRESFAALLKDKTPGIPDAVKPLPSQGLQTAVLTHRPMGMGAGAFGASVFLLLLFLTLGPLLLLKNPLVRTWPALDLFYRMAGAGVQAPGEGLRLSEMTARHNISGEKRTFAIQAKLTNVSQRPVRYPALEIALTDANGKTQIWDVDAQDTELKPGETAPVELELENVPDGGKTARLRVAGP